MRWVLLIWLCGAVQSTHGVARNHATIRHTITVDSNAAIEHTSALHAEAKVENKQATSLHQGSMEVSAQGVLTQEKMSAKVTQGTTEYASQSVLQESRSQAVARSSIKAGEQQTVQAQAKFLSPLDMIPGGGLIKDCVCIVFVLGLIAALYKMGIFDRCLDGKTWDVRRWCRCLKTKCIKGWRPFGEPAPKPKPKPDDPERSCDLQYVKEGCQEHLWLGPHDEFDGFECTVTVYCVKDIKNSGFGKAKLDCNVAFWYTNFKTKDTKDGKWDECKKMLVPQGATACHIKVTSLGRITNETIGTVELMTKIDLVDQPKVCAEKKWYKLMKGENCTGQIQLSFVIGDKLDVNGRSTAKPFLDGMESDACAALVKRIQDAMPNKKERNIKFPRKMLILADALAGELNRIGGKGLGGPKKLWFKPQFIPMPILGKVIDPSKPAPPTDGGEGKQKWLFCWYQNEQLCNTRPTQPDGCFMLIKVTKVARNLKKSDEFTVEFQDNEKKKLDMSFKVENRSADAVIEGFEYLMHWAKESKLAEREAKDSGGGEAQAVKDSWKNKSPDEKWAYWEASYRKQGMPEEVIAKKKQQFMEAQMNPAPKAAVKKVPDGAGKGGAKGKGGAPKAAAKVATKTNDRPAGGGGGASPKAKAKATAKAFAASPKAKATAKAKAKAKAKS